MTKHTKPKMKEADVQAILEYEGLEQALIQIDADDISNEKLREHWQLAKYHLFEIQELLGTGLFLGDTDDVEWDDDVDMDD